MNIKINTYDKDYIIIETSSLLWNLCQLQIEGRDEDKDLINELNKIRICCNNYETEQRRNGKFYTKIDEVAIEKNSSIGKLIINKISKPEFISHNQVINALLKCIYYEEWEYYDTLCTHVKYTKQFSKVSYTWFKITFGEDIANYIANSSYLYPTISRNKIYLFKNNKITKIDLPEKKQKNPKTRTKTK